jgi:hypothetical protein
MRKPVFIPGLVVAALAALVSCTASPQTPDAAALEATARAHVLAIPQITDEQNRSLAKTKGWRNPYLIVRADGVALLDPDDHLERIVKPEELTQTLGNLPPSAWPYGRVVAVTENSVRSSADEDVKIRKNRAVVAGTLESLHVLIHWIPSA